MSDSVFVIGDGDGIRRSIEFYLLNGDLEGLGAFSTALTEAIRAIAQSAISEMQAHVVFAGGDEIFFITSRPQYQEQSLRGLMDEFVRRTESSISFGVGPTVETAFVNLRRAKAKGPGGLIATGLSES